MNKKHLLLILYILGFFNACRSDQSKSVISSTAIEKPNHRILATSPHVPEAFSQGLFMNNETLIEGTGLNGKSWISTYQLGTLEYDKKVILPDDFFGEGLTLLDNKIYQLTYKSQIGFIYDFSTFEKIETFSYPITIKEGWGITHNNEQLIVSDGSSTLYFLDTINYEIQRSINVHKNGSAISKLNELEYIEGYLYANVWGSNSILRINPSNGEVEDEYDLTNIVKMEKSKHPKIEVLNGIAYDTKNKNIIVTGKYWYNYYRIVLNPRQAEINN